MDSVTLEQLKRRIDLDVASLRVELNRGRHHKHECVSCGEPCNPKYQLCWRCNADL